MYDDLGEAPVGVYPAILVDMKHTQGAKKPSFDDPTVIEEKDVSVFLFAFEHEGRIYFVKHGT